MITYPIYPPQLPGDAVIEPVRNLAVARSRSPYTSVTEEQEFPGESLGLKVRMPKMSEADARAWAAWMDAMSWAGAQSYFGESMAARPSGGISITRNLLVWTRAFDQASWQKVGSGVTAPVITPDFTADPPEFGSGTNADKIAFPSTVAGGTFADVRQTVSPLLTAGKMFVFSIYLRADAPCTLQLYITDGPTFTGQAGTVSCSVTTSWQRFSCLGAFARPWNTLTSVTPREPFRGVTVYVRSAGQAAINVYADAAQLEYGSALTTYQFVGKPIEVYGAGQTGKSLVVDAQGTQVASTLNIWRAGDWFALNGRLYTPVLDVNTDGTLRATAQIFPRLRTSPADGDPVNWWCPMGLFRMPAAQRSYSIDEAMIYGLEFDLEESL